MFSTPPIPKRSGLPIPGSLRATAPMQQRQLKAILFSATNYTETAGDAVKQRIKAETEQTAKLYGFNYSIDGKPVTTNDIEDRLRKQTDLAQRLKTWNASKEVGKVL